MCMNFAIQFRCYCCCYIYSFTLSCHSLIAKLTLENNEGKRNNINKKITCGAVHNNLLLVDHQDLYQKAGTVGLI